MRGRPKYAGKEGGLTTICGFMKFCVSERHSLVQELKLGKKPGSESTSRTQISSVSSRACWMAQGLCPFASIEEAFLLDERSGGDGGEEPGDSMGPGPFVVVFSLV